MLSASGSHRALSVGSASLCDLLAGLSWRQTAQQNGNPVYQKREGMERSHPYSLMQNPAGKTALGFWAGSAAYLTNDGHEGLRRFLLPASPFCFGLWPSPSSHCKGWACNG